MYKKDRKKIFLQKVRMVFYVVAYPIVQLFVKEKKNNVLFLSDSRTDFSGNFLFVKEEIEKREKYQITGIFKKNLKTRRSLKDMFRIVYYIAKSKYIFVDDFYPVIYPIKLKKSKKLIQLWHAMGAYKTVGYSRMGKPGGPTGYNLTHRNYTGTIVSSESIRKNYAEAFGIDIEKVHALGIPRTDIFFDEIYSKNIKEKIYEKYPQLKGKKVIMFAPTFRGNGQGTAYYDFSCIDFKKLEDQFKKDYICIIKLHPFIKNRPEYNFEDSDFYLDLTSEREINDLLFITDILITDYSSVIYEYSFFKKPIIFYVPDMEEYISSRDFYYSFEKYNYGTSTTNMKELIQAIKKEQVDIHKINEFHNYFCSACDGHATKRVVDYFLEEE